ncbi:hypothetical protein [Aliarcobacter butzleri]
MLLKIKSFLSLIGLNIGIAWIKLFDKRQLLFKNLKPLKWFRYFIYTITIVVFYLLLEVLQTYFLNVLNDYNFQPIIYTTIVALALILKIVAIFFMFGIVFLEY